VKLLILVTPESVIQTSVIRHQKFNSSTCKPG